jgi:hypothetical protein
MNELKNVIYTGQVSLYVSLHDFQKYAHPLRENAGICVDFAMPIQTAERP